MGHADWTKSKNRMGRWYGSDGYRGDQQRIRRNAEGTMSRSICQPVLGRTVPAFRSGFASPEVMEVCEPGAATMHQAYHIVRRRCGGVGSVAAPVCGARVRNRLFAIEPR
jgi:hypothetical protein